VRASGSACRSKRELARALAWLDLLLRYSGGSLGSGKTAEYTRAAVAEWAKGGSAELTVELHPVLLLISESRLWFSDSVFPTQSINITFRRIKHHLSAGLHSSSHAGSRASFREEFQVRYSISFRELQSRLNYQKLTITMVHYYTYPKRRT